MDKINNRTTEGGLKKVVAGCADPCREDRYQPVDKINNRTTEGGLKKWLQDVQIPAGGYQPVDKINNRTTEGGLKEVVAGCADPCRRIPTCE